MKICITGSTGLIGSSVANLFLEKGHRVVGIDNNMRADLFGKEATTNKSLSRLGKFKNYTHHKTDIRNQKKIFKLFAKEKFNAVIHCAGQPSHDRAAEIPLLDFKINTEGTLILLEATRLFSPKAVFIFTSTNKVYGDNPNKLKLRETKTRYRFFDKKFTGINESMSIDQNLHSLMGASKAAADVYVQEYGKNYGLKTTCLRLGCVTGAFHAGVKAHGFLSFLIKSLIHENSYQIIGYKGKQVRDQISADDVALAMAEIIKSPSKGEVFNLGGGIKNNASILELIYIISKKLNIKPKISYKKQARKGDHICYISDISKFKKRYPEWKITKDLGTIIDEIIEYELETKKTNVLGVKVDALTYPLALKKIQTWIEQKTPNYVCVSAVHLVMECQSNKKLMTGVNKAGLVTPDGMPLVWLSDFKAVTERVYGPELTLKLCKMANKNKYSVYLLGGASGQSKKLKTDIKKRFPKLRIVGHQDTPIRPIPQKQNKKIIKEINKLKPDLIFVGTGCPNQELWMIENINKINQGVMIGVGAAFNFITGKVKQAPKWMQKSGLEWFYRLMQEPRRLWKRYLVLNTVFIGKLVISKIKKLLK